MKEKNKPKTRFAGTDEVNADHWPIERATKFIRLLSHDALKRQKKGVVLFSVGGAEVTVGKDKLDTEPCVFSRSMYGELVS